MDTNKFGAYTAHTMARLFGTNGIRGVFGEDMSLQFAHDITLSLAAHFGKGPVLVGYDGRHSGLAMAKTVCSTLNYAGLDCSLAGLVPTPCLEFAVKKLGYAWGIMITASHNPPEYNGIKPAGPNGTEISRQEELDVESIYYEKSKPPKPAKWGQTRKETGAIDAYIKGILSHVDIKSIQIKNLSIVLDMGNGAQAITAKTLCENLGCKTFEINGKIDGDFPGRGSEPTPENLSELSSAIKKHSANLGVAFDGDGDRSMFCDELGNILTGDRSALLFTEYILEKKPGSTVITCLNSSGAIEELASKTNSNVIRTKVGSVEVTQRMLKESSERFSGVGSEPLPGKSPSIFPFISKVLHPRFSHKVFAVIACAPFPMSNTMERFLICIDFISTWESIPLMYASIAPVSFLVCPHLAGFGGFDFS